MQSSPVVTERLYNKAQCSLSLWSHFHSRPASSIPKVASRIALVVASMRVHGANELFLLRTVFRGRPDAIYHCDVGTEVRSGGA
jgi:hypothetical protein